MVPGAAACRAWLYRLLRTRSTRLSHAASPAGATPDRHGVTRCRKITAVPEAKRVSGPALPTVTILAMLTGLTLTAPALIGSGAPALAQNQAMPTLERRPGSESLPTAAPPETLQSGAETGAENPFATAPFAPLLGFDLSAAPVIRAQISPRRQTVLSAEISGKIAELDLREGDRFRAGEQLVGLDCAAHEARLDRARAQEQGSRRRLETAGRLDQLSSISRLEYDEAVAALAAAEAESALADIFVARCAITAPFDGRVSQRMAEPFQYVAEGEPLIAILDDRDLEVELIAPSRWLAWLREGHAFSVEIDELADTVAAEVSRLGARVDPVSQSVKVFATITDAPAGLMAGMSGHADLAPPNESEKTDPGAAAPVAAERPGAPGG